FSSGIGEGIPLLRLLASIRGHTPPECCQPGRPVGECLHLPQPMHQVEEIMTTALLLALFVGAAEDPKPADKEPPAKLGRVAKEDFYKTQGGKEEDFVGVVQKVKGGGGVGFGRFNPYRLEMKKDGKTTVREIYVGGKKDVLDPYVGKTVKVTGKAVDMEVEGTMHHEIWPARLEIADAKPGKEKPEPKAATRAPVP